MVLSRRNAITIVGGNRDYDEVALLIGLYPRWNSLVLFVVVEMSRTFSKAVTRSRCTKIRRGGQTRTSLSLSSLFTPLEAHP